MYQHHSRALDLGLLLQICRQALPNGMVEHFDTICPGALFNRLCDLRIKQLLDSGISIELIELVELIGKRHDFEQPARATPRWD